MIRQIGMDEKEALLLLCRGSAFGCRVAANLLAYGTQQPFASFYLGGGSAVSILDGQAVCHLAGEGDVPELCAFLRMNPMVSGVLSSGALPLPVQEQGAVMEYRGGALPPCPDAVDTEDYEGFYRLLTAVPWMARALPPFDVWYVDACHKVRHGVAVMMAVKDKGQIVSGGMITAQSPDMGILACVATREHDRGRGLGGQVTAALTRRLWEQGKRACLFRRQGENEGFYRRLGYENTDRWVRSLV